MLKDLVLKNRSYRGFDESYTFTREDLLEYVDLARICSCAANKQGLKYYIANDKNEVESLLAHTHFAMALPELHLPKKGSHPTAFIIICQDKNIVENANALQKDIGIVAQTILLAAAEKNLGGLMIGAFDAGKISETAKLAENLAPMLLVALGKPTEKIVLTEVGEDGHTSYYRDAEDVHYVPKRKLEDVIIN